MIPVSLSVVFSNRGTLHPIDIFNTPYVIYTSKEIREIQQILGLTNQQFADMFGVSKETVIGWRSTTKSKSRNCKGIAAKLMYWAAKLANEKMDIGSSINNRIRLAYDSDIYERDDSDL